MINCTVKLVLPIDTFSRVMLLSSITFIKPIKVIGEGEFVIYDCNTKALLADKLSYLAEASSIDFEYTYKFFEQ